MSIAQCIRLAPAGPNSADDDIDLVVGQHSAGVLRERRHGGSGNSVGGYATNRGIVGDSEVNRVAKCNRSAALPIRAVTSGAVPCIEEIEIHNFTRWDYLRIRWVGAQALSRVLQAVVPPIVATPVTPVWMPRVESLEASSAFVLSHSGRFHARAEGERQVL